MKTRYSRVSIRIWLFVFVLAGLVTVRLSYSQANVPEYRGVFAAEIQDGNGRIKNGANARIIEMNDRLIVNVSNLDGLLYEVLNCPTVDLNLEPDRLALESLLEGIYFFQSRRSTDFAKRGLFYLNGHQES